MLILSCLREKQYTSNEYKAICESNGMQISMSRKGTPIDDSPMESWHGILKKETLYNNTIKNIKEYQALVEDRIEFYNTTRIKNRKKSYLFFLFFMSDFLFGIYEIKILM